jgi:hypothetical protein
LPRIEEEEALMSTTFSHVNYALALLQTNLRTELPRTSRKEVEDDLVEEDECYTAPP